MSDELPPLPSRNLLWFGVAVLRDGRRVSAKVFAFDGGKEGYTFISCDGGRLARLDPADVVHVEPLGGGSNKFPDSLHRRLGR